MTENRNGQVVTFYSYKGGTGRTMALANVAWILAANGHRVLVVDWDLESPGLHRFFAPFINPEALATTGGVVQLIQEYEWATTQEDPTRGERWFEQYAKVYNYSFSLDWDHFPDGGSLDFLSAGKELPDYTAALFGLSWDDFYDRQGGDFLDALRADMIANYDYTLIDSRTGQSDVAEICTSHLPDTLVDCFTLSEQGIEGAAQIARRVQRQHVRPVRILPATMRVDPAEKERADAGRSVAKHRFAGLPANMSEAERDTYWATVQVPYQAYYAYEECLATFADVPGTPSTLLAAYEALTAQITNGAVRSLPLIDGTLRARVNRRFARRPAIVEDEVTLRYATEDQVWAEWIEHVLVTAGVRVNNGLSPDGTTDLTSTARPIKIISQANVRDEAGTIPHDRGTSRDPLAIYVADVLPITNKIPIANSAFLAGLGVEAAVDGVLKLVGRPDVEVDTRPNAPGARFPGSTPTVFNVPTRNARFTGREKDLHDLRSRLRDGGAAVVIQGAQPVALHGMGGIGKTQVAMEYAHRFRSAYDVVWWITSDPFTFVDSALIDLGEQLGLPYQTAPESWRSVLAALNRGEPYGRWLVIFDNAEDPRVGQFLPQGSGHVIITSRGSTWGDRAQTMQVDVFERRESIAHLAKRVPSIKKDEADRVAEMLGDLPIAIAAAGAWLADTGTHVDDYLRAIEQHGPRAIGTDAPDRLDGDGAPASAPTRSVEATWDLSLTRLRERSGAAYRLLQLCSVLSPEIALDLIYSDEIAQGLVPLDATMSERLERGKLVQQIHRLALLRLDPRPEGGEAGERSHGGQVLVHRLLQYVVRSRMTEEELAEAKHEIHLVLAALRPDGEVEDPDTWPRFRMLWPHLEISEAVKCPDEAVRRLMIDRVRYLWLRGDLNRARLRTEETELAWQAMLDETTEPAVRQTLRRQLLHLRSNLANILRDLGHFDQSRELDERVLEEQGELLHDGHAHSLITASGLAADMRGLGRYPEALALDVTTHAKWQDNYGDQYPRTLTALSNLAVSHRLMGDFRSAQDLDDEVYQRRKIVLGENHPSTLISASSLGRDLRDAGEYDRSVQLLRTVWAAFGELSGPNSRHALNTQVNLAVSLRSAGHAQEADSLLELAYERLNDSFGRTNPDTLGCRLSWAANLLTINDTAKAERELVAVRDVYEQVLGKTHPHTIACVNNMSVVARAAAEIDRAVVLARSAAEGFAEVLGAEHPYALAALMNVAVFTTEQGDQETGVAVIRDVAGRIERVLGPEHPNTLRCMGNLALILRRADVAESGVSESDIYDRMARRVGQNHPATIALRDRLLVDRVIDPHPF